MKHTFLAISLAAGLSLAGAAFAPAFAAGATAASASHIMLSAKKKHRLYRQGAVQPAYVACTKTGCRPTPPGCYPAVGREWNDNPSAYDVIVCPRYWRG